MAPKSSMLSFARESAKADKDFARTHALIQSLLRLKGNKGPTTPAVSLWLSVAKQERFLHVRFRPKIDSDSQFMWARLPKLLRHQYLGRCANMEAKQKHPNLKLTCIDCCNTQLEIMVKESPARSGRPPCSGHCCKRHLKINFKEIGWDWVV
ncbi:hypothetical protein CEXT_396611, partial [Caerostris extrusa]